MDIFYSVDFIGTLGLDWPPTALILKVRAKSIENSEQHLSITCEEILGLIGPPPYVLSVRLNKGNDVQISIHV